MIFVKPPQGSTPEEELLLQFQGMIAEYERAQIAERCRRGKRYRARSGLVNVLSGAPYGYRYVKKTEKADRKKITRSLRKRGGFSPRCSSNHERPRGEWIEIAVPSIAREDTFALAQERLERNKQLSRRHTKEPTILQGLLVCRICGYSLYRTSTRTSKRKIYYYRCSGSDNYRYPNGSKCNNRPIRQDYLDELVWEKIMDLLEDPELIHKEINRRVQEAQNSNPAKIRKETLIKEITRLRKGLDLGQLHLMTNEIKGI